MSLKNVVKLESSTYGQTTWLLQDADGNSISAFAYFCSKNLDYKFTTQERYAQAVAKFIDFLIEAKAFGEPVTKAHLNAVIDAYPIFLRDGSKALSERLQQNVDLAPGDRWLLDVAQALYQPPYKPGSFSNTLAAINRFLSLSEALALEAFEKASYAGIVETESYVELINALSGCTQLSQREIRNMRQNSVLGTVIRFKSKGMRRPRVLTTRSANEIQDDLKLLDFPFDKVLALSNAATCERDKALWLLLAASGIRTSEAMNLRWSDIDFKKQEIFIYDPRGRRFGLDMLPHEKIKFKGRIVSSTYLIKLFKKFLFIALENYIKKEYIPSANGVLNDFVFQYVEYARRGQPLINASNTSLNASFKAACIRAGIQAPKGISIENYWTLHSLRHLYGVYMLNDYPVDSENGIRGLELCEVQKLMGHLDASSTERYARKKRRALEEKLEAFDKQLYTDNH